MSDETVDSFRRRMLGLPLRVWLPFIVAFVVGFALTAVLWPIVSGKDVQTVLTFLQTVLTFLTLVAAVVAVIYARDSVRSANDTATIMDGMASNLAIAAKTMQTNLRLAERSRQERQYERIHAGLVRWLLADYPAEAREGQAVLRAALSPFPADKLPACWAVAGADVRANHTGAISSAITEVEQPLAAIRKELDDLLKSTG